MSNIITKEDFKSIMSEVEKTIHYHKNLNDFFRKNNVDGYIYQPDSTTSTLRLLHLIFGDTDKDEWISRFCFDLNFGKKWKPEMIVDKDGTDIKLETVDDLYEILCKSN